MSFIVIGLKMGASVVTLFVSSAFGVKIAEENGNTDAGKIKAAKETLWVFFVIIAAIWF